MRLYHFLSKKWALGDILRRRLRLSRIETLNDPFELLSIALSDPVLRARAAEWKKRMNEAYGLVCFSRKSTNPVQWTHYADHHRGICLGFDVADDTLVPVNYVSRRLVTDTLAQMLAARNEDDARQVMLQVLATKYSHWRYEAEVRNFGRLSIQSDGNFFIEFDDNLVLREVLVGAFSDATRADISAALGTLPNVAVHKKRLAFKSFSVVRNRDEKNWK